MLKFDYFVNLEYEHLDEQCYQREIEYLFDNLVYNDDARGIEVIIKNGFSPDICDGVAKNEDAGFTYVCAVANKVCKILTILLQIDNYDFVSRICKSRKFIP